MFKLDLEEAEEQEIKLPISVRSLKKQESFRKICTSALLTMPKPLTMWITTNCGKFFKIQEYQTTFLLRNRYAGQEETEPEMEECGAGVQIGKGVCQGYILSPYLFNLYENASCETPGWMKHKLESTLPGKISITSDMLMTPPLWQKAKRNYRAS